MEIKGPSWKEIERFLSSKEGGLFKKFLTYLVSSEEPRHIQVQVPVGYKRIANFLTDGTVKMSYEKLLAYLSRKSKEIDKFGFPYKQDLVDEGFPVYFANKMRLIDAVIITKNGIWIVEVKTNPKEYFSGAAQLLTYVLDIASDFRDGLYTRKIYPVLVIRDFDEIEVPREFFINFCKVFGIGVFDVTISEMISEAECFPKFPEEEVLVEVCRAIRKLVEEIVYEEDITKENLTRKLIEIISNVIAVSRFWEILSAYGLGDLGRRSISRLKQSIIQ